MISISTITSNRLYGNIVINEMATTSDMKTKPARISRTATLDGVVYINHFGVSDGDRTLRIESRLTKTQEAVIENIYKNQTFVLISIDEGLFLGVLDNLRLKNGFLKINILIKQKEN